MLGKYKLDWTLYKIFYNNNYRNTSPKSCQNKNFIGIFLNYYDLTMIPDRGDPQLTSVVVPKREIDEESIRRTLTESDSERPPDSRGSSVGNEVEGTIRRISGGKTTKTKRKTTKRKRKTTKRKRKTTKRKRKTTKTKRKTTKRKSRKHYN
jgi:hypothetical protein